MYSFPSQTTTAPPLSAGFMTMSSLLEVDQSREVGSFRWLESEVSYSSQAHVDVTLNLGVGTMRRFSVDGSLKQSHENIIVRITLNILEDGQGLPSFSKNRKKC